MAELKKIDALYAQARALESAAQAATVIAVSSGASTEEVEEALKAAVLSAPGQEKGQGRVAEAESHLAGRRCVCLAVTRLALKYGSDPERLVKELQAAGENGARVRLAVSPSDLIEDQGQSSA